ncbi:type I methionyl aminopeptidase [Clostridium thermosuccinogenes]|jgi:methionyl aminopeptidase|uniref:Methionine aminopeptidase n=1 Tax=Clostridium thermosuccinogenes TaxID=84032 RepID=A0A2K2F9H1_9CLOT|nr:type I methionyl aminopeptidase [Pseudoclostridium thermosuccinogenes]AUS98125.1 type I methionyl aminopeptidase [Pseudoclostridium thermosuccinogenes]PNT91220.1 type I methionyl aminopeptidase [Pseudoclostridium thermosuccinogenes]PNT95404.1 type I methionyl aminopeptidase [Pseudoclostridium thermosuccinogenes]PNT96580.1 type I methionyl aminopeptidase [Pseudoclostridium thermosuccinogenes]
MISIKSKSELEIMKKGGKILAAALEKVKEAAKPGVTTQELDSLVEQFIIKSGAIPSFKGYEGLPGAVDFPGSICASVNDEVVHGIPGLRQLKNGDIISVDIGVYYEGFHTDAARTFAIGDITPEAERLIKVTEESFFEGIKHAVKGKRIVDISAAIQDHVEKNGYSVVRDYVGHGIGREMHELPQIPNFRTRERGPRLEPGFTLAIEPMVNQGGYQVKLLKNRWTVVTADGSLSAHYENTIAVTDGEPIILTIL